MVFLDNIVNVSHCGANEEGKDKCDDVVLSSPKVHVDGVKDNKERKPPRNAINDNPFAVREELVDDGTEEEEVDEGPDEEGPWCGGDVCLLAIVIDSMGSSDCIDI